MDSIKAIREAAATRGAKDKTLIQLDILVLLDELIDHNRTLQKDFFELEKRVREQQDRLDALERDHDHVAEVCQDLAGAVFREEAI